MAPDGKCSSSQKNYFGTKNEGEIVKTSDSISKIAPALLAAQKAITFAAKDATNPHFRNKYADLPAVVDAVKPALNEAGITFLQSATPSESDKLHLVTRLLHSSGEWIEDTLVMPLPKQDPQGYGSAMTYARRYALAAITGLYQDDDDGNAGSGVVKKAPEEITKKQMEGFIADINKCETVEDLLATGDVIGAKPLSEAQRAEIATAYSKRKREIKTAVAA